MDKYIKISNKSIKQANFMDRTTTSTFKTAFYTHLKR